MGVTFTPTHRALAAGGLAAAVLIGAFALGSSRGSAAAASSAASAGARPTVVATAAGSARITVTGTGDVTGTPNQLVLAMGVQVNGSSVGSALAGADDAVTRVTAALRTDGVAAADIQTSGFSIWPNYPPDSQTPSGYGVSESLTATLNSLAAADAQIDAAVHAGGNATTVSGISLNLTDTSALLATARALAVADATVKATQYAKALGQPLGPVVSITDQAPTQPFPVNGSYSAASAKAVPISPGSQQLSISITAVFAVLSELAGLVTRDYRQDSGRNAELLFPRTQDAPGPDSTDMPERRQYARFSRRGLITQRGKERPIFGTPPGMCVTIVRAAVGSRYLYRLFRGGCQAPCIAAGSARRRQAADAAAAVNRTLAVGIQQWGARTAMRWKVRCRGCELHRGKRESSGRVGARRTAARTVLSRSWPIS